MMLLRLQIVVCIVLPDFTIPFIPIIIVYKFTERSRPRSAPVPQNLAKSNGVERP